MNKLVIENAKITFRNFKGEVSQYNRLGARTFAVIISDEEQAESLRADGWNVKQTNPTNPDYSPINYIEVTLSYKFRAPQVWLISSTGRTSLTEDNVETLDYAEISNIDLIINPSRWEVNGKTGLKAYLDSMYVTLDEDEFASKYAGVPVR